MKKLLLLATLCSSLALGQSSKVSIPGQVKHSPNPVTGSIFYTSNSGGTISALSPGTDGNCLVQASGIPSWSSCGGLSGGAASRFTLWSGASSITNDSGAVFSGTGNSFVASFAKTESAGTTAPAALSPVPVAFDARAKLTTAGYAASIVSNTVPAATGASDIYSAVKIVAQNDVTGSTQRTAKSTNGLYISTTADFAGTWETIRAIYAEVIASSVQNNAAFDQIGIDSYVYAYPSVPAHLVGVRSQISSADAPTENYAFQARSPIINISSTGAGVKIEDQDPLTYQLWTLGKKPSLFENTAAANIPVIIKGASSQSANLTEWQNNSGTPLSAINSSGAFTGNSFTATSLAANGTNCSANSAAGGVDASGNAENCTALILGSGSGSANRLAYWSAANTITSSSALLFNETTVTLAPAITATGALSGFVYTGAVHTNQTASTEIPSIYLTTAGRQWATGALTTQREVLITQPTYSFVGASTITNAATVGIAGAPIKSTNATITNTHGLLIQAGAVSTATNSYGLTVNAQTGATNNYVAQFLGGNVGIGTSAPLESLDVNGNISVVNNASQLYGYYTSSTDHASGYRANNYYSSTDKATRTGRAGLLTHSYTDDGWFFRTSNSTSANNNITWISQLRLTSTLLNTYLPLIVNHTAALGRLSQAFEVTTGGTYGGLALNTFSATAAEGAVLDFNRSKSGTKGTQTAVATNDVLGYLVFRGSDGSAFQDGGYIKAVVNGTVATGKVPADLLFFTTPAATGTAVERVKIATTGNVGIGTGAGNAPGALLDLGLAGTTLGVIRLAGSTSGNVSLQPNAVAGSGVVLTLPAVTGTVALKYTKTLQLIPSAGVIPNTTGDAYFEPYSILATNDLFNNLILRLGANNAAAPTVKSGVYGVIHIPEDYDTAGTATLEVHWTSTLTSGNVVFDFDYRSIGGDDAESLDQASYQESLTVTDAAPTAANRRLVATMTLTSSNLAPGDTLQFFFGRDGAAAADTLAGSAIVEEVILKYTTP